MSACSLIAADTTDLKSKILVNISMAMYLWKCVVSGACSSLPSWLQRRLVATAPAQDQSLRLARGGMTRTEPRAYSSSSACYTLSSQSCCCRSLKTYTALSGVPRNMSFGKQLPKTAFFLLLIWGGENFPLFFRTTLQVDLFLVGVPCIFAERG